MKLYELTALELAGQLRAGAVTQAEAISTAAGRIAACQPGNNAFITVADSPAPAPAPSASPLAGVPMAYKDNLCTRGMRTTCASKILGDFTPCYDATAVERLTAAGAVSMGKLNLTSSPWAPPLRPPVTARPKTPGSHPLPRRLLRRPPPWRPGRCGTPSAGHRRLHPPACPLRRHRHEAHLRLRVPVRPGRLRLRISSAPSPAPPPTARRCWSPGRIPGRHQSGAPPGTALRPHRRRAGQAHRPATESASAARWSRRPPPRPAAAGVLRARGAVVEECSLPLLDYAVPAYYILACAEASSNLARFDGVKFGWRAEGCGSLEELYRRTRTEGFGPEVKKRILLGTFVLSADCYDSYYKKALQARARLKAAVDAVFQRYDLLLTPVAPTTAPRLGEGLADPLSLYLSDIYTVPANLAGLPALSMPCGFDRGGLPIGAQLIGPALGDLAVLDAAHAYQQETDWHRRHPDTPAAAKGGDAL